MSTTVRVPLVSGEYTLVTSAVAMVQVKQQSSMVLGTVTQPNSVSATGFDMSMNEKFINNAAGTYVWIKPIGSVNEPYVVLSEVVV